MNELPTMMNQQPQQQQLMNINPNIMSMNQLNQSMNQLNQHQQPQPQMAPMNRSYGLWAPPPQFQNPNPGVMKPLPSAFNKSLGPRSTWKGKKVNKPNDKRRKEQQKSLMAGSSVGGIGGGVNTISGGVGNSNFNNYKPPTLNELQHQNRLKTRKFFPKKKFNKSNNTHMNTSGINYNNKWSAPFAPRNTTSFLIRAKKSGGIASLVSPCPVTPAVLPTPIFSPSREVLVDMAKEEWGVDGYGSMKGRIRLRSPGHELEVHEDEEEDEGGSSESDVEEHVEVERRLDHDLSRFEMIYNPNNVTSGGSEYQNVLENRVDDQDTHIAQLEEENLILKERLFLMERELGDLRRRMRCLERQGNRGDDINAEVVENESENECDSHGEEAHSMEDNNEDFGEEYAQVDGFLKGKGDDQQNAEGFEAAATTEKHVELDAEEKVENTDKELDEAVKVDNVACILVKETNKNDKFFAVNKTKENIAGIQDTDTKENNKDKNKSVDSEVKVHNDDSAESSDHLMAGDVCMEEIGKDSMVTEKDTAY